MTGNESLSIQLDEHAGCVVLRVTGTLDARGYPKLRDLMLKCATNQPPAVLVVVDGLHVATESLLSVFTRVAMRLSDWPHVPLLLVAEQEPARAMLLTAPGRRFVSVYSSIEAAALGVASQPPRRQAKMTLPRLFDTARQARSYTTKVCEYWLPGNPVVTDAVVVVNELVENVLAHTTSDPALRLELRATVLSVAVGDSCEEPARLREGGVNGHGGLGLVLVAQLTRTWGSNPAPTGGKVVWGVLDTEPSQAAFRPMVPDSRALG